MGFDSIMSETYYSLSLKKTQKAPRQVHFRHPKCDLSRLNHILNLTLKNLRLVKNEKSKSPINIQLTLNKMIPDEYFGCASNRSGFFQIVKKILTQSYFECIYSSVLIKSYDFEAITWLSNIRDKEIRRGLLMKTNIFLLDKVVKSLVRHYHKYIRTYNGNEVQLVSHENWISFKTRMCNRLKKSKFLIEVKDSSSKRTRGYLKIVPKDTLESCNFRAIVDTFRTNKTLYIKNIASKIYKITGTTNGYLNSSLYDSWVSFLNNAKNLKIFGVKLDIKDAYGNVNISILSSLVSGLPNKRLSPDMKKFIVEHINNQFVLFQRKVFRWNHGLLQGDHLSASLCELYMTHLDKTFLSPAPGDPDCFLHRTVDDYFFCSTEEYKVRNFINHIETIHEINPAKTESNLSPKTSRIIPYCGKTFDLGSGSVGSLFKFSPGYEIRHKFKLWNIRHPISENHPRGFLTKAVSFSSTNNYFTRLEFNTVFNSERRVLENFFEGMVFVAYKFDAAVMALRGGSSGQEFDFVPEILEACVGEYVERVCKTLEKSKGKFYKGKIGSRLLRIVGYRAFLVVFRRRNEIYKEMILRIRCGNNLKICFPRVDLDLEFFDRLPESLRDVKINRKVKL